MYIVVKHEYIYTCHYYVSTVSKYIYIDVCIMYIQYKIETHTI